jgi:hypothetical protein
MCSAQDRRGNGMAGCFAVGEMGCIAYGGMTMRDVWTHGERDSAGGTAVGPANCSYVSLASD